MELVTQIIQISLSKSQSLSQDHRFNQRAAKLPAKLPRLRLSVTWQPRLFFSTAYSVSGIMASWNSFCDDNIDRPYQLSLSSSIQGRNTSPLLQNCRPDNYLEVLVDSWEYLLVLSWAAASECRTILLCRFQGWIFLLSSCARLLSSVFLFDFLLFLRQVLLSFSSWASTFSWFLQSNWSFRTWRG